MGELIDFKRHDLIVKGSLPSLALNSVGNPSEVKNSCYGWYNNTSGESPYAPTSTAGVFLRLVSNVESYNVTFYYVLVNPTQGRLFAIMDGGTLVKLV